MSCKSLLTTYQRPLLEILKSSSSRRCLIASHRALFLLPASASSSIKHTKLRARPIHTLKQTAPPELQQNRALPQDEVQLAADLLVALDDAKTKLLDSPKPPDEREILAWLERCAELAPRFSSLPGRSTTSNKSRSSAAHDLLLLGEEEGASVIKAAAGASITKEEAIQQLSAGMYTVMASPGVFITQKILEAYVSLQRALRRPESLSEIFSLFAHKPVPLAGTSPIQYKPARPSNLSSAIPKGVANMALESAIASRNMLLCLDIINTTVGAPAYRRLKAIRNGLVPATAATLAPLAAYAVASQMSAFQETMSSELATNMAFVGLMSYMAFTATIGFVAFATANDQMDRVVWSEGMPLRTRWLMEEQRAMLDKVAGAWGFRSKDRRGEESGPDWESLREFTGLQGMILDKVSLMEGME